MSASKVSEKTSSPPQAQVKTKPSPEVASMTPPAYGISAVDQKLKTPDTPPIQRKKNNTGLPDQLKTGIEHLSGYSMDDVQVHFNSSKPAQLQAHAYAQGTDIHLGPGQERHLPHEAWHVVQQKQGRVRPTMQLKGKVDVNDDAGLEREADVMGEEARQGTLLHEPLNLVPISLDTNLLQRVRVKEVIQLTKRMKNAQYDHIHGALVRVEIHPINKKHNTKLSFKKDELFVGKIRVANKRPDTKFGSLGQKSHTVAWELVRRGVEGMGKRTLNSFINILDELTKSLRMPKKDYDGHNLSEHFDFAKGFISKKIKEISDNSNENLSIGSLYNIFSEILTQFIIAYQLSEDTAFKYGRAIGKAEAYAIGQIIKKEEKYNSQAPEEKYKETPDINIIKKLIDMPPKNVKSIDIQKIYHHQGFYMALAFPQVFDKNKEMYFQEIKPEEDDDNETKTLGQHISNLTQKGNLNVPKIPKSAFNPATTFVAKVALDFRDMDKELLKIKKIINSKNLLIKKINIEILNKEKLLNEEETKLKDLKRDSNQYVEKNKNNNNRSQFANKRQYEGKNEQKIKKRKLNTPIEKTQKRDIRKFEKTIHELYDSIKKKKKKIKVLEKKNKESQKNLKATIKKKTQAITILNLEVADDRPNTRFGIAQRSHTVAWSLVRTHLMSFKGKNWKELVIFIKSSTESLQIRENLNVSDKLTTFKNNLKTFKGKSKNLYILQYELSSMVEEYIGLYQLSNAATYASEFRPSGHGEASALSQLKESEKKLTANDQSDLDNEKNAENAFKLLDAKILNSDLLPHAWITALNHWKKLIEQTFPNVYNQKMFRSELKKYLQKDILKAGKIEGNVNLNSIENIDDTLLGKMADINTTRMADELLRSISDIIKTNNENSVDEYLSTGKERIESKKNNNSLTKITEFCLNKNNIQDYVIEKRLTKNLKFENTLDTITKDFDSGLNFIIKKAIKNNENYNKNFMKGFLEFIKAKYKDLLSKRIIVAYSNKSILGNKLQKNNIYSMDHRKKFSVANYIKEYKEGDDKVLSKDTFVKNKIIEIRKEYISRIVTAKKSMESDDGMAIIILNFKYLSPTKKDLLKNAFKAKFEYLETLGKDSVWGEILKSQPNKIANNELHTVINDWLVEEKLGPLPFFDKTDNDIEIVER